MSKRLWLAIAVVAFVCGGAFLTAEGKTKCEAGTVTPCDCQEGLIGQSQCGTGGVPGACDCVKPSARTADGGCTSFLKIPGNQNCLYSSQVAGVATCNFGPIIVCNQLTVGPYTFACSASNSSQAFANSNLCAAANAACGCCWITTCQTP